uniref:SMP-LTD domain-containing protein n=1 Tax=Romanomermis culicivorax TaxID=13658 RepID=A0A915HL53_ROMCU
MVDLSEYLPSILGSTMLLLTCWTLGRFNYSIFWVIIFIIFNTVKSKLWQQRQKRVIALQHAAMKEKEVILAQLKDLPAWVQFPDTERVEWMNKVIFQLWPYIGEYSKWFIKEIVEPQIKAHMPNMLKSFRFEEIDIGDIPLRVSGIKVYSENVGRDKIIMDMDVA